MSTNLGFNHLHMVLATTDLEWQSVRQFRQKNFFDRVPIDDPYTWTFESKEHAHFVLYKGTTIIGYAHIQLWSDNRAALRIIVLDEKYRNKGYGSEFLKLCEH